MRKQTGSVDFVQVNPFYEKGTVEYEVRSTEGRTEPKLGEMLSKWEVDKLIEEKVKVRIVSSRTASRPSF